MRLLVHDPYVRRDLLSEFGAEPVSLDVLLRDGSDIVVSKPQEFRQVIERDYAKYGKLADLLKAANQ